MPSSGKGFSVPKTQHRHCGLKKPGHSSLTASLPSVLELFGFTATLDTSTRLLVFRRLGPDASSRPPVLSYACRCSAPVHSPPAPGFHSPAVEHFLSTGISQLTAVAEITSRLCTYVALMPALLAHVPCCFHCLFAPRAVAAHTLASFTGAGLDIVQAVVKLTKECLTHCSIKGTGGSAQIQSPELPLTTDGKLSLSSPPVTFFIAFPSLNSVVFSTPFICFIQSYVNKIFNYLS